MTEKTQKKLLLFFHFEKKIVILWKGGKKNKHYTRSFQNWHACDKFTRTNTKLILG